MEKRVSELINKIWGTNNFSIECLNDIIKLHEEIGQKHYEYNQNRNRIIKEIDEKTSDFFFDINVEPIPEKPADESYLFDRQIKRLEMALQDKLKQINVYLSDEYLDILTNMLLYRDSDADVKDLRLINGNSIAIIRENSIELGDDCYNADRLSAGMCLQEEAYLQECAKQKDEKDFDTPEEVFKDFYTTIRARKEQLKKDLNILDKDVHMYFDVSLDDFYFNNIKSFRLIITELPNTIEIYDIDATNDKWILKKISGKSMNDIFDRINCTILEEDFLITDLKSRYNGRVNPTRITNFDVEIALANYKQVPFSLELLIQTYNSLFNNGNCMLEENKSAIERLKFITTEKYVQNGFEYAKAFNYTEAIFDTIYAYKKQIMDAINGENKFPEESLVGTVKKLKP